MFRLTSKIVLESERKWTIDHVTAVEIVRDTEQLTDTCKVTLPKSLKWDGQSSIPLRRGDRIQVWLGYDGVLELAFVGYIRDIGFKTPVVLTCEDEMYRLKQMPTMKKAYRTVTIAELLEGQGIKGAKVFGEQRLGQFRVTEDNVASLLGRLQDSGIRSFFRYENGTPVLYSGVLFERDVKPSQVFATGLNLIEYNRLEQVSADSQRIKVKATSIMPNNKRIRIEVGDMDGQTRTVHCYNKTEAELRAWAEQEIRRLKRDGLSGSFKTFGYRLVDKLDTIGIIIDGKRMGLYHVKKNIIRFDTSGYRQEVTISN